MAKYCSKECELYGAVCDFCKYYHYNGEDVIREGTVYKNVYTGKGYYNYHKVKKPLEKDVMSSFVNLLRRKND